MCDSLGERFLLNKFYKISIYVKLLSIHYDLLLLLVAEYLLRFSRLLEHRVDDGLQLLPLLLDLLRRGLEVPCRELRVGFEISTIRCFTGRYHYIPVGFQGPGSSVC